MSNGELMRRTRTYLAARTAQEQDHTDGALNQARTEAHDELMMQMDIEGIEYENREDSARIAAVLVDPDLADVAATYVTAYDAWWASLMSPPFNDEKPASHRKLCREGRDAWRAFDWALNERGIKTADRYALARELVREEDNDG